VHEVSYAHSRKQSSAVPFQSGHVTELVKAGTRGSVHSAPSGDAR